MRARGGQSFNIMSPRADDRAGRPARKIRFTIFIPAKTPRHAGDRSLATPARAVCGWLAALERARSDGGAHGAKSSLRRRRSATAHTDRRVGSAHRPSSARVATSAASRDHGARALVSAPSSLPTHRDGTSDRLFRADAESYRAPRRVVGAYRVRSRRSSRIRVRDARASSPAAPRLDPHRLTSPVSFPSSRVSRPIDAGRRQARRGDRADQREAPGPAFLSAGRRHHRMGPVPGRRRVLHRLQSRLGRCADRTRDARTPPFFARLRNTKKRTPNPIRESRTFPPL